MLRPWVQNLVIPAQGRGSLSHRIAQAIMEEIQRGRLTAGDSLPGTRDLANELKVNRKSVVVAYEELAAQGWVKSDSRRGTFVLKSIREAAAGLTPSRAPLKPALATHGRDFGVPLPWALSDDEPSFDDGVPDQRLIPVEAIAQAYGTAARAAGRQRLLGYGDPRGTDQLRQSIARMLNATRGLAASTENICVTRGSQMALFVIAQTIVAPGDTVLFEELSYPPAVQAFRLAGANVDAVKLRADGIDLDALEAACRKRRVRALYLTPGHHFPTTVVMRPSTRLRLRGLAAHYDHEFHFDHLPMLPLASNDPDGQIIYVGSFSKVLSPSLRVGYIAAQPETIERLGNCIGTIDRQGDPVTELAIVELIESGNLRRHIKRVHAVFNKRRADFAALVEEHLDGLISFDIPSGGLAFWVRLAEGHDLSRFPKLEFPGRTGLVTSLDCRVAGEPCQGIRLGFASLDRDEAASHLERLSKAFNL